MGHELSVPPKVGVAGNGEKGTALWVGTLLCIFIVEYDTTAGEVNTPKRIHVTLGKSEQYLWIVSVSVSWSPYHHYVLLDVINWGKTR